MIHAIGDVLFPAGRFQLPETAARRAPLPPSLPDWDEPVHEADLLARWPHLRRTGPQPHNRIAGTFDEAAGMCATQAWDRDAALAVTLVLALDRKRDLAAALLTILREVGRAGQQC